MDAVGEEVDDREWVENDRGGSLDDREEEEKDRVGVWMKGEAVERFKN